MSLALTATVTVSLPSSIRVRPFSVIAARCGPRATRLTAFGDPYYPAALPPNEDAAPQLRAALRSFDLTPLPATRGEVESLQALYPQASSVYLGAEATEERAKAVGPETTHLHIASHGLLDDRSPLDSALAFSIPPR